MTTRTPLRVAVVSRRPLTRGGLVEMLSTDPSRLRIVAVCEQDGHLGGHDVTVYDLIGLASPSDDDLRHLLASGVPVVGLQPDRRPDLGEGALALGIADVVTMDVCTDELFAVVERTAAGRRGRRLGEHRAELGKDFGLTPREVDILALIGSGVSNQDIADELFLSVNSIKSYIRSAYRKIGVITRSQAVRWVVVRGLVPHVRN